MTSFARTSRRLAVALATLGIAASCGGGGGSSPDTSGGSGLVDGASVTPSAVVAAQSSFPGEFAADFLRRNRFTSLLVEIDYAVGHPPSLAAMALLKERLEDRCDKPGGVTVLKDDAIPLAEIPPNSEVSDLEEIENAHRDFFADSNSQQAVLYILYVTGDSSLGGGPATSILAITYHGSSIALYVDVADQGNNPFETTEEVEGMALVHEAGHALGLVNGGVAMVTPHEDEVHSGHDESEDSAMYWLIQIDPVSPNIGDAGFALYGARCEQDMAAAGGLPATAIPATVLSPNVASASRSRARLTVGTCGGCLSVARARAAAAAGGGACPTR